MPSSHLLLAVVALLLCLPSSSATVYPVTSGPGLGRRFDGIGVLSGGGCTSRLLVDYVEPQRSEILDYLFLPSFGASLHLLKVEIGGDAQSTEGTEPSHMHYEGEENYHRGYEWWLMREAKRRNPSILLYALSWGFPRWVGEGGNLPFTNSTVRYTLNWLRNAKAVHNLTIDYAGIWNERGYTADYIISLSRAIKAAGLSTRVVGHDSNWDICAPVLKDAELAAAVDVIGAHYPGSSAAAECQLTGKPLWASEEMSKPWNTGGQCWARVLNQNYVRANMTGSIAWNLIATYYDDLPFPGDGVLHGDTPWDGHYDVGHVMHATSHTTHFTAPGWSYLSHGSGVGLLSGGGSYVSLTPLDRQQLTIVIETMPFNSSQCSWSTSPSFTIAPSQNATFQLDAPWSSLKGLYLFTSNLSEGADPAQDFTAHGLQAITDGVITLTVHEAMLYTLSSINSRRGSHPTPPAASAFPLPYADDFNAHEVGSEAPYFIDQTGSWQVVEGTGGRGRVMRQQAVAPPIAWCGENAVPYSVLGDHTWTELNVSVDVLVEGQGMAFLAARVESGGCMDRGSSAVAFGVSTEGWWALCNNTQVAQGCEGAGGVGGKWAGKAGVWYGLRVEVVGEEARGYVDGVMVANMTVVGRGRGWAAIGSSWGYVQFDRFSVAAPGKRCEAEEEVVVKKRSEAPVVAYDS